MTPHREPAPPEPLDHLDVLALDALRSGRGSAEERAHAEACGECRETLEDLAALAAALRSEPGPAVPVPPEVDEAILALGARELRRRTVPARAAWGLGPRRRWAAAAAALVLAAGLWGLLVRHEAPEDLASAGVRARDLDRNGRIDIVDAYSLALRLRSGGPQDSRLDLNADGRVDALDVDAIARESVSLGRRSP
ncbi:MAG: hypothetical protein HY721_12055 [Planctomycetes bacterium]|nr:hypothetical protein [Planctomycetota bacterium]